MAQPTITLQDVRHVAKLSRLDLADEQIAQLRGKLESILAYVAKITEVDTVGIEPMPHAVPLSNVLREDTPGPTLTIQQVLQNAPATDERFFAVPKVIGGNEDSAG